MENNLINYDKKHIWHPYTSMTNPIPTVEVVSAKGAKLKLGNGEKIIDGMSSWWCALHGYNVSVINRTVKKQLKKMSHVMFGGITHKPAVNLAKLLIKLTPLGLEKVFFCDSGSVAVEVAMKMALQYWYSKGKKEKNKFLTVYNGYHGDTFNAMSVCDPVTGMHEIYTDVLPKNYFVPKPKINFNDIWDKQDLYEMENVLKYKSEKICAVIIEPIVQGAGGMHFYHKEYLKGLRELCNKYDVLLICDEIATGFGRTGELFASNHSNITPDIMTLGKAMTGGYLTGAAVLTTDKVAHGISENGGVFMHGPTFMGNPLFCAVSYASIKFLIKTPWKQRVKKIESQLKKELFKCFALDSVHDVRVLGAIGVVEMKNNVNVPKLQKLFIQEGVWIRPFGKLIYIMPPFIIKEKELQKLTTGIYKVLKELK